MPSNTQTFREVHVFVDRKMVANAKTMSGGHIFGVQIRALVLGSSCTIIYVPPAHKRVFTLQLRVA